MNTITNTAVKMNKLVDRATIGKNQKQPWTETSETVSQNKSFLSQVVLSDILVIVTKSN
jgi:hypothetical protein